MSCKMHLLPPAKKATFLVLWLKYSWEDILSRIAQISIAQIGRQRHKQCAWKFENCWWLVKDQKLYQTIRKRKNHRHLQRKRYKSYLRVWIFITKKYNNKTSELVTTKLNCITKAETQECLAKCSHHLQPKGKLVFLCCGWKLHERHWIKALNWQGKTQNNHE